MEMEEVPLKELDEAEFGSRELIPETGEAYQKERSVIRREDDMDG